VPAVGNAVRKVPAVGNAEESQVSAVGNEECVWM
jgi:hypothetical protein